MIVKALSKDYDLPEEEVLELNVNRFMQHIGIGSREV